MKYRRSSVRWSLVVRILLCLAARAAAAAAGGAAPGVAAPTLVTETIGHTLRDRPIPLVVAAHPEARKRGTPAVLILCGQHGDEPVPRRAAARILRWLANPTDARSRDVLARLVTLVIADANPDGAAAGTRANAAGADLNRDWPAHSQPETQAVLRAFARWRPQMVVDVHEWAARDQHSHNSIETPLVTPGRLDHESVRRLHTWTGSALQGCVDEGIYVERTHWSPASDPRLAHRHFASEHGVPAFLYEAVPAGRAPDEVRVAAATAFLRRLLLAAAAASPAPVVAAPVPRPLPQPPPANPLPHVSLAVGVLLLWPASRSRLKWAARTTRWVRRRRARGLFQHALEALTRVPDRRRIRRRHQPRRRPRTRDAWRVGEARRFL